MKTTTAVALSLGLLLDSAASFAQGTHPPPLPGDHAAPAAPGASDHAAPAPVPTDGASSPPPLPRPAPPSGPPCRLAEHSGVEDADAGTVGQIVCSALARAGAQPDARYRVSIGKLGSVYILSVALEGDTFGSTADTREMRLGLIEDVAAAAPRIATAIVHGTVIEDIEAPPPAIAPEVAKPAPPTSNSAKIHFALGMVGTFPPLDRSGTPAAGADLELHAEWSAAEIVTDVRFGGSSSDRSVGITFVEFSMGGRFFTSAADLSPFIGGGFAWSYLAMNDNVHNDFDGSHTGLGAYGELGLEIGRTHHTHLAFGLRVDLPFYSMENDVNSIAPVAPQTPFGVQSSPPLVIGTLYYVPLSLEIRVTF